MDVKEFKKRGYQLIDYIADYHENIRKYRVYPDVKPGYMKKLVPDRAPRKPEHWDVIMKDIDRVIVPGLTHWLSPYFHAYFPSISTYPSILGDLLCAGFNNLGFTWAASPACTELETIMTDWVGRMIGLPDDFLHDTRGDRMGGGVIQPSVSESTLVCMLAARAEAIRKYKERHGDVEDAVIMSKLVAYGSDQTHSHFEKDVLIAAVKMTLVESDDKTFAMTGPALQEAIDKDKAKGLIPFFICTTLGSTGVCSFDNLVEIGPICKKEGMWFHVDAAYAGATFVCPEFRYLGKGMEAADSFVFNTAKIFLVNYELTLLWIKDCTYFFRAFNVEPLYLQHENTGHAIDYMHWQLQLSRRFRALKLWFTLRTYGIEGFQKFMREHVRLAKLFEKLVRTDDRFEIGAPRHLGLVVFRYRGDPQKANVMTENLLKMINQEGKLHCVPCKVKGLFLIRFCLNSPRTTDEDIKRDWRIIQATADKLDYATKHGKKPRMKFSVCDDQHGMRPEDCKDRKKSLLTQDDHLRWSATMEGKQPSKSASATSSKSGRNNMDKYRDQHLSSSDTSSSRSKRHREREGKSCRSHRSRRDDRSDDRSRRDDRSDDRSKRDERSDDRSKRDDRSDDRSRRDDRCERDERSRRDDRSRREENGEARSASKKQCSRSHEGSHSSSSHKSHRSRRG